MGAMARANYPDRVLVGNGVAGCRDAAASHGFGEVVEIPLHFRQDEELRRGAKIRRRSLAQERGRLGRQLVRVVGLLQQPNDREVVA
jgi:hypothetical protein